MTAEWRRLTRKVIHAPHREPRLAADKGLPRKQSERSDDADTRGTHTSRRKPAAAKPRHGRRAKILRLAA